MKRNITGLFLGVSLLCGACVSYADDIADQSTKKAAKAKKMNDSKYEELECQLDVAFQDATKFEKEQCWWTNFIWKSGVGGFLGGLVLSVIGGHVNGGAGDGLKTLGGTVAVVGIFVGVPSGWVYRQEAEHHRYHHTKEEVLKLRNQCRAAVMHLEKNQDRLSPVLQERLNLFKKYAQKSDSLMDEFKYYNDKKCKTRYVEHVEGFGEFDKKSQRQNR